MTIKEQINRIKELLSEQETNTVNPITDTKQNYSQDIKQGGSSFKTNLFITEQEIYEYKKFDTKSFISKLNKQNDNVIISVGIPKKKEFMDGYSKLKDSFNEEASKITPKYRDLDCTLIILFENGSFAKKYSDDCKMFFWSSANDNSMSVKLSDDDEIPLLKNYLMNNDIHYMDYGEIIKNNPEKYEKEKEQNEKVGFENYIGVNYEMKGVCISNLIASHAYKIKGKIKQIKGFFEN